MCCRCCCRGINCCCNCWCLTGCEYEVLDCCTFGAWGDKGLEPPKVEAPLEAGILMVSIWRNQVNKVIRMPMKNWLAFFISLHRLNYRLNIVPSVGPNPEALWVHTTRDTTNKCRWMPKRLQCWQRTTQEASKCCTRRSCHSQFL